MISRGRQLNITQGRTREGENDPEELQEDVLWSEEPEEEITFMSLSLATLFIQTPNCRIKNLSSFCRTR